MCVSTWILELLCHGGEGRNLLFLWGVDHHHCGPQNAQQTTNFPMHIEPLIQKVRGEDCTGEKNNEEQIVKLILEDHCHYHHQQNPRKNQNNSVLYFDDLFQRSSDAVWR